MSSSLRWCFIACLTLMVGIELSYAMTAAQVAEFYTGTYSLDIWDASHNYTNNTALQSSMTITEKSVTRRGKTSYYHYFVFNGVPNYQYVDTTTYRDWQAEGGNKKNISAQSYEKCIPVNPTKNENYVCDDTDDHVAGFVGILINGAPLWTWHTSSYTDAVSDEVMDKCGGHPNNDGKYHLHGLNGDDFNTLDDHPGCFKDFNSETCPAPLMGVALDGYNIYGPQMCDTDGTFRGLYTSADLTNGWRAVDKNNPTQQGDSTKDHDYEYRLHTDQYYHITCFRGEKASLAKCKGAADKRDDDTLDQMVGEAKEQANSENKIERAKEEADFENKIERTLLEILLYKKAKKEN